MTECGWLSDRIPAVAIGRAEWTPEEVQHLNVCRACQQEWELIQVTARLGESSGVNFESPALADAVVGRLRREREAARARRRTWSLSGLAAAAAIGVAVWTGDFERETVSSPAAGQVVAGRAAIPLPELESLQPAELDSVLWTMDETNVNGAAVNEPSLGDLNADELESVLASWEG